VKSERLIRKVRDEDDPATDFVIAGVDGEELRGRDGWIDITGADDLEIMINDDGRVLWINGPKNKVRICGIRGRVAINDMRSRRRARGRE
jgi:hypothetical protein